MSNPDLASALEVMRINRLALVAVVAPLSREDMAKSRRGGWSIDRTLQHVIESEVAYVKLVAHLRGAGAPELTVTLPRDGADAVGQLVRTRATLVDMTGGIDDETLYRMASLGANEYSVLSVLENDGDHDHEHLAQISRLIAG